MWHGFSGKNMWWGGARGFLDAYNNACKTVEPFVQDK